MEAATSEWQEPLIRVAFIVAILGVLWLFRCQWRL
jgi:hypothetical protein